jgi:D-alanyl-D-alanine carboxypeptidase
MYPVASLTKLLSALVIEDYMDMEEMIFIGPASINTFGNSAYLHLGERLSVKDLLHATLLVSSNDATEALARSFGRDEFIKTMKSISSNIGAYTTYWADPSGLGSSNISSAYDMAIILEHIYKNKRELLDITLKKSYSIRDHTWTNQTHFLSLSNYLGGKNGYTEEANRTTAGVFSIKDMVYSTSSAQYIENEVPIIVVVLGSENRDRDTLILLKEVGKIVKDRQ